MRRAALALNMEFSFGGLHDAAVGLRRRCARLMGTEEPEFVEERRLSAEPILRASDVGHVSSSELELLLLWGADLSGEVVSTALREVLRTAFEPISRSGDVLSESDPYDRMVGGAGDPSDFFESAPRAKRPDRFKSTDAFGGDGIGDDSYCSGDGAVMGAENVGGGMSIEEVVGVSMCSGVFWNSASVPFSVSSRHRTPRFDLDGDFFLIGENCTPFFTAIIFFRRGDPFIGDDVRCGASARVGNVGIASDRIGDGSIMFTGFLLFGVPRLVGAKNSVTGSPPSGRIACEVAFVHEFMILVSIFLAVSTASVSLN